MHIAQAVPWPIVQQPELRNNGDLIQLRDCSLPARQLLPIQQAWLSRASVQGGRFSKRRRSPSSSQLSFSLVPILADTRMSICNGDSRLKIRHGQEIPIVSTQHPYSVSFPSPFLKCQ